MKLKSLPLLGLISLALGIRLYASPQELDDLASNTQPATLAYHLATNAFAHAQGRRGGADELVEFQALLPLDLDRFVLPAWSYKFWLKDVQGLSATCIGYKDSHNGQGLITMISPRHYLCATHMHPEHQLAAFLDTHNQLHWRKTLERVDVGLDTTVGLLDKDLPESVGFLPILPETYTNYLPTAGNAVVQGIGMNQDMLVFGEPMSFASGMFVSWNSHSRALYGLDTNWNVTIRGGDSSNPALLLVGQQLVLVSHNYTVGSGPNYARQILAINQAMHHLSVNHATGTEYQVTRFVLTNWPSLRSAALYPEVQLPIGERQRKAGLEFKFEPTAQRRSEAEENR